MSQITWRAPDDLVGRVKAAASREGRSVNDFLTRLAQAAVDPAYAKDGLEATRERLAQAGLLASPQGQGARRRPPAQQVAAARAAAGRGESLAKIVARERG